MRLVLLIVLLLAGCDASDPTVPIEDARGWIEGTYTLPSGEVVPFRTEAGGEGYVVGSANERFGFGSRVPYPPADPDAPVVTVGFTQYYSLFPSPGRFATRFDVPGRDWIEASFQITNVPGLEAEGLLDPSVASVYLPEHGTLDLVWTGDGVLEGAFSLRGRPFGVADSTVRVAVEGRFEMPVPR